MATTNGCSQDTFRARFTYTQDHPSFQSQKPFVILSHLGTEQKNTNLSWEVGPEEVIEDIRGRESEFTLDRNGFCFIDSPTTFDGWEEREQIETLYLKEVEGFLKKNLDRVDHVQIFDWRRRAPRSQDGSSMFTDMNNPNDPLGPAERVHLDQSPYGVLKRVRLLMGDRAETLLAGRVRLINVWRPLKPVENWPLALCDGRTASYDDLIEVDLVRRDYVGSTMFSKRQPKYRWYCLQNQRPDEVCLFKNFDSKEDVESNICPHVAFPLPGVEKTRESIEVRALVFTLPSRG